MVQGEVFISSGICRYCGEDIEDCTCDKTGTLGHITNHDLGSD